MLSCVGKKELNLEGTISRKRVPKYYHMVRVMKRQIYRNELDMCNIMKLVGYAENTRSLTDKALWWKAYNEHVIKEIRQLRGRVSTEMKTNIIRG